MFPRRGIGNIVLDAKREEELLFLLDNVGKDRMLKVSFTSEFLFRKVLPGFKDIENPYGLGKWFGLGYLGKERAGAEVRLRGD